MTTIFGTLPFWLTLMQVNSFCLQFALHNCSNTFTYIVFFNIGKTTTTERMLYYSGKTHTMGEVHHGNTITDFLAQERERGITICSAAVTFPWKDYRINLLDTPGHIDFTMEVEQSLGAVDGVVVVLDSSAGVEAQTVTVWNQADHYKLPRMVFANKMDRADADFQGCLNDLERKLDCVPVPLQLPLMGEKGIKSKRDHKIQIDCNSYVYSS